MSELSITCIDAHTRDIFSEPNVLPSALHPIIMLTDNMMRLCYNGGKIFNRISLFTKYIGQENIALCYFSCPVNEIKKTICSSSRILICGRLF